MAASSPDLVNHGPRRNLGSAILFLGYVAAVLAAFATALIAVAWFSDGAQWGTHTRAVAAGVAVSMWVGVAATIVGGVRLRDRSWLAAVPFAIVSAPILALGLVAFVQLFISPTGARGN